MNVGTAQVFLKVYLERLKAFNPAEACLKLICEGFHYCCQVPELKGLPGENRRTSLRLCVASRRNARFSFWLKVKHVSALQSCFKSEEGFFRDLLFRVKDLILVQVDFLIQSAR